MHWPISFGCIKNYKVLKRKTEYPYGIFITYSIDIHDEKFLLRLVFKQTESGWTFFGLAPFTRDVDTSFQFINPSYIYVISKCQPLRPEKSECIRALVPLPLLPPQPCLQRSSAFSWHTPRWFWKVTGWLLSGTQCCFCWSRPPWRHREPAVGLGHRDHWEQPFRPRL